MNYALLQTTLEPPAEDKLRRAIVGVPGLAAVDASSILKDAYGILVRQQSLEAATAFHRSLAAEGIHTEVVPEPNVPQLPPTKFVKRVEVRADGFVIYDPLGRTVPVPWAHVYLVAAGMVRVIEFKTIRTPVRTPDWQADEYSMAPAIPEYETHSREERVSRLLLEIILTRGVARLTIEAGAKAPLLFGYLGDRKTGEPSRDFALLVQDILERAPHVALNRGAYYLKEKGDEIFFYPSKSAFFEEIQWLLWQMTKSR